LLLPLSLLKVPPALMTVQRLRLSLTVFKYRNKIGKIVVKTVPYSVNINVKNTFTLKRYLHLTNRLLDQGYKKRFALFDHLKSLLTWYRQF
jgi:hypothetical protein